MVQKALKETNWIWHLSIVALVLNLVVENLHDIVHLKVLLRQLQLSCEGSITIYRENQSERNTQSVNRNGMQ